MAALIRRLALVLVMVAAVVVVPGTAALAGPADSDPGAPIAPGLEEKASDGEVPVIAVTRVPGEQVVDEVVADLPDDAAAGATAGPAHQVVVTVDAEGLEALAANPEVVEVVENKINRVSADQWVGAIGLPATHDAGWDGGGRTVAVLDTGVQSNHPYLSGKVIGEACFSQPNGSLYRSLCPSGLTSQVGLGAAAPCDQTSPDIPGCDHGTHVAGIAAGGPVTSPTDLTGAAPGASIIAVKVFSKGLTTTACGGAPAPCIVAFDSEIVAALNWLQELREADDPMVANLDAANLSLGGGLYASTCDGVNPGITAEVNSLRSLGIATVVASGNNGQNGKTGTNLRMASPACISTAVSVGATTGTGAVASYSNLTAGTTILAPGSNIISSVPSAYAYKSGTSMAAPVVAGAIAALREQQPGASVTDLVGLMRTRGSTVSTAAGSMPELQLDAAALGVPSDPTGITTVGTFERVSLSWAAPAYAGTSPVTSYLVTASPGGRTCTSVAPTRACTVTGLTNGTSYSFTVEAVNGAGSGTGASAGGTPKALPAGSPFGAIDVVSAGIGTVTASGWAIDPETSAPIPVHVYVGGAGYALTADGARADVDQAYGYGPNHAYSTTKSASPGAKNVCIYAINVGVGATTVLGCRTVTVPGGSPIGSLDVVSAGPGTITVGGWAIDPDTAASIPVHVYVDGAGYALTASGYRPDVAAFFGPYGGNHGFNQVLTTGPGAHTVCAYGINTGVGTTSTLGCRTVTVPGGSPFGSFDVATRTVGGSVNVGGWAIDPDTAASIPVHVYVVGPGYPLTGFPLTANTARPDVGAIYPAYGAPHGFSAALGTNVPAGSTVCAYAINTGVGGTTLLGCKVV